ncbi:MAG: cysteine--tRNA ligase [Candidatus Omnitrophica bacterium CG11_big_fil_rev_8_21_14_0_20_43_6]|nr:MAG: cysteine--tRNA ligase [Candidatus Omnitrophica bacterium CG11_big_fil_rev_8_21_14_0_20_43_6]
MLIYNSLTRKKEEFIPLKPKEVRMYVCGPTVYDQAHIGHARSAYVFDVVRRYLTYRGHKVKFIRNVTDVDDKIINKAQVEFKGEDLNIAVKEVSTKYLDLYHEDMKSLGILEPDHEPKATEYVTKSNPLMQKFIQQLIEKGCAYVSEGDVYFDIKKAKNYGKLSNQDLDKMEAGSRIALGEKKKDPLDFALWKSAKPGEPAWDSPWGRGRPGWHIECSVMSSDILGDEFDIHGGGIDLIFPHHENEIAQSEGAGRKFAHYWMHHGLLTINGQKMAKSLGNFITIKDVLAKYPVDALKVFYLQAHYSNPVDFSWGKLEEAHRSLERFEIIFHRIELAKKSGMTKSVKTADFIEKNKNNFIKAMDDDFNTSDALASLFDLVNDTNKFIDQEKDVLNYAEIVNEVERVLIELGDIFGLVLKPIPANISISENEIDLIIARRTKAKLNKDYVLADRIRKELEEKGIILEDTKDVTTWRRKL